MPQIPIEQLGVAGAIILGSLAFVYLIVKTMVSMKKNTNPSSRDGFALLGEKIDNLHECTKDGFKRMVDELKSMNERDK